MSITQETIATVARALLGRAAVRLPRDVKDALERARAAESNPTAQAQLDAILANVRLAEKTNTSICQDTGVPLFFVNVGTACRIEGDPARALAEATGRATQEVPLRQTVIHPLDFRNPGTNTGWGAPVVHYDLLPGAPYLEITATTKGFGAEMRSALVWILTSEDPRKAALRTVLDTVEDAMGEPCPPVIAGLGIGGTAEQCMLNAKRALFRAPLGGPHPDADVASLEREILAAVNALGLGPMGFGGGSYALAVHVELCGTHTALVPIAVILQCWAHRYSTARIYDDGRVEYLTHPEEV
jgi:tartrate/fumarate subfamily iron-sulfur-dependent hydro-lyase alpha chain